MEYGSICNLFEAVPFVPLTPHIYCISTDIGYPIRGSLLTIETIEPWNGILTSCHYFNIQINETEGESGGRCVNGQSNEQVRYHVELFSLFFLMFNKRNSLWDTYICISQRQTTLYYLQLIWMCDAFCKVRLSTIRALVGTCICNLYIEVHVYDI